MYLALFLNPSFSNYKYFEICKSHGYSVILGSFGQDADTRNSKHKK